MFKSLCNLELKVFDNYYDLTIFENKVFCGIIFIQLLLGVLNIFRKSYRKLIFMST